MASLVVDSADLVLQMSDLEKIEGVHRDVRVPLSAVKAVRAVDNAIPGAENVAAEVRRHLTPSFAELPPPAEQ